MSVDIQAIARHLVTLGCDPQLALPEGTTKVVIALPDQNFVHVPIAIWPDVSRAMREASGG